MLRIEVVPDSKGRFNLCEFCPELKDVNCNATIDWNGEATYSYTKLGHIKYKFKSTEKVYINFINLECDKLSFKNNTRLISISGELPRLSAGYLNSLFEGCINLLTATGMLFVNNRDQLESKAVFKNCFVLSPDFEVITDLWSSKDFTEFYYGCRAIDDLHYPLFSKKQCSSIEILDGMFAETPYLKEVRGTLLDNLWNLKSVKRMFYRSGIRRMDNLFKEELHKNSKIELEELAAECKNLKYVNPNYFAYLPFSVDIETKKSMFRNVPAKINM